MFTVATFSYARPANHHRLLPASPTAVKEEVLKRFAEGGNAIESKLKDICSEFVLWRNKFALCDCFLFDFESTGRGQSAPDTTRIGHRGNVCAIYYYSNKATDLQGREWTKSRLWECSAIIIT